MLRLVGLLVLTSSTLARTRLIHLGCMLAGAAGPAGAGAQQGACTPFQGRAAATGSAVQGQTGG